MPVGMVKYKGWAGLEIQRLAFLWLSQHTLCSMGINFQKGALVLQLAGPTVLLETAKTSMAVKQKRNAQYPHLLLGNDGRLCSRPQEVLHMHPCSKTLRTLKSQNNLCKGTEVLLVVLSWPPNL